MSDGEARSQETHDSHHGASFAKSQALDTRTADVKQPEAGPSSML